MPARVGRVRKKCQIGVVELGWGAWIGAELGWIGTMACRAGMEWHDGVPELCVMMEWRAIPLL